MTDQATTLSAKELLAAQRINTALQALREVNPWMNAFQVRLLLTVAQQEGASLRELVKATEEKQATVSRALLDLTRHTRTKGGPELITVEVDPHDLRVRRFALNHQGRQLVKQLLTTIAS